MLKNSNGMTLLEVIIALFLFTLMIGVVFPVFLITRQMNLSSKAFTDARQLAQSEIETIFNYSLNYSYTDSLYQIVSHDGYTCNGFSWTVDVISGEIIYNALVEPVTCTNTFSSYQVNLTFTPNTTLNDSTFKDIKVQVFSTNFNQTIKRYETIYAHHFHA